MPSSARAHSRVGDVLAEVGVRNRHLLEQRALARPHVLLIDTRRDGERLEAEPDVGRLPIRVRPELHRVRFVAEVDDSLVAVAEQDPQPGLRIGPLVDDEVAGERLGPT